MRAWRSAGGRRWSILSPDRGCCSWLGRCKLLNCAKVLLAAIALVGLLLKRYFWWLGEEAGSVRWELLRHSLFSFNTPVSCSQMFRHPGYNAYKEANLHEPYPPIKIYVYALPSHLTGKVSSVHHENRRFELVLPDLLRSNSVRTHDPVKSAHMKFSA